MDTYKTEKNKNPLDLLRYTHFQADKKKPLKKTIEKVLRGTPLYDFFEVFSAQMR